jgi:hypothetical protein
LPDKGIVGIPHLHEIDAHEEGFVRVEAKLVLNDDNADKPEGIHMMIGRKPILAFGNSNGDRQMLEYTKTAGGARLALLVLHEDDKREYAYGPAQGLPDTKVGRFKSFMTKLTKMAALSSV